jgi:hypothetical protein
VAITPAVAPSGSEPPLTGAQAEALLAPVTNIDGFVLACLIDATTGMILAARQTQGDISLGAAAAGATDIAAAVTLLTARLGTDDILEDAMLSFGKHLHLMRLLTPGQEPDVLLLVILDRQRTNLAMARREIRDFCAGFAA